MQKFSLSKGFTLIELLVVIAILGILAAVVLIAINPAERIKEANDTQIRSDVSTIASAIEACFTGEATGYYDNCNTISELTSRGYLKTTPQTNDSTSTPANKRLTWLPATGTNLVDVAAYAQLQAESADNKLTTPCTGNPPFYYVYRTSNGSSNVVCTAPTAP